jgi:hypothetical protein
VDAAALPARRRDRFWLVPTARSHHPDPRERHWPVIFSYQQQRFHRGLPFLGVVLCVRHLGNVFCRISTYGFQAGNMIGSKNR